MTGKKLSETLGMNYGYYRARTSQKKGRISFWVKAFVLGYKLGKGGEDVE